MDAAWDLSWRAYPAIALMGAGVVLALRGDYLFVSGMRRPLGAPRRTWTWVRGMRLFLFGTSLAVAAAGWMWHIPALVAAGLVIGFEETLETSIVVSALRQSGD
jgi:hypothetical protein